VTRPSATRAGARRAALALAGTALAAIAACGGSDRQKSDSGKAPVAALANANASANAAPAALPGALSKPIDQMSGDELYGFVHRLNFVGGNERQRRCRGRAECRGRPSRFTSLRVDAVDAQDSLSAAATPAYGVVAARTLNHGQDVDTMYNTRPGAYEYYLIVLPGTGGSATWRLEELTTTNGARAHRSVATGRFKECGHKFVRGARADFKSCTEAAAAVQPAAFSRTAPMQTDGESPIWISCALGCCTADPPDTIG